MIASFLRWLRYKLLVPKQQRRPEQAAGDLQALIDEGYLIVEMRCMRCEHVHVAAIHPENECKQAECDHCHHMEAVAIKNLCGDP